MSKQIKDRVRKRLQNSIKKFQERINESEESLTLLEEDKFHYLIHLISLWEDEGEESVTYEAVQGMNLKEAIVEAEELFMEINNRDDIQANRVVSIKFSNGHQIFVPYSDLNRPSLYGRGSSIEDFYEI